MTIQTVLPTIHIASAVILGASILLQQRGEGLGAGIGGTGMEFSTKRGVEKWLFRLSIVFSVLFIIFSVARLVIGV